MHPTVKLRLVLIPSIAKQIPTPLCEHKAWENKRLIHLPKASASFHLAPHLNTENTRAILPIARILFLMTSLRKLAALPARRWTRRWKEKGEKEKLISSSVAIKSLSKLTSKKKENVFETFFIFLLRKMLARAHIIVFRRGQAESRLLLLW